jgi:predicted CXXCH cytochrome family protein
MRPKPPSNPTGRKIARCAAGAAAAVFALALALPLHADIRFTKHNLAKRFGRDATDEREVCVFCHFPAVSAAPAAAPPAAPRWQRLGPGNYAFSIYDDIGRAALDGATPVGSQSVACLACHDSNQAFTVTRFSFDHPFGVPYRGARASRSLLEDARARARRSGIPLREAEFLFDSGGKDFRPVFESTVENRKIFWASPTNNSLRRSKSDLPLYPRRDNALGEDVPFIECSSCHDPHTTNKMFLRVSNDNGELCLACHDK